MKDLFTDMTLRRSAESKSFTSLLGGGGTFVYNLICEYSNILHGVIKISQPLLIKIIYLLFESSVPY
jgi:hypothetical protein